MTVAGLDGVVVAETVLSEVDGEAGKLIVRGLPVEALAGQVSFEEVARRLWEGLAPPSPATTAAAVRAALGRGRLAAFRHVEGLRRSAAGLPPVSALRLGLASLRPGGGDGELELDSAAEDRFGSAAKVAAPAAAAAPGDHLLATAAIPVFAAAFERARHGLPAVPPEPALGHAADFLRMLRGEPASDAAAAALDAYLVTVAEHGMNASTFTARVVASTRAGVLPAVIAALCALEGPLHGGAPGPVLEMLDALRGRADVAGWLAAELAAGRRLMGFGHRIYRVRDPRADVLKAQVAKLRAGAQRGAGGGASGVAGAGADDAGGRLALAERVEREALAALRDLRPGKRIDTNVEFYTAVLLDALRIDRGLFTSVFAAGRVAGWTAHVFEQERANRLIRPQSAYVGPRPSVEISSAHGALLV